MEDEWRRWQAAVPPVGGSVEVATGVPELAAGLHAAAAGLASRLSSLGAASGRTLLHGDFKTANLFFRPAADGGGAAAACPCDFQWAGTGVCMQDVMYLLWTSVEPGVVAAEEEELLAFYREQLRRELAAAGVKRAPTDCELRDQYEVRRRPPPAVHAGVPRRNAHTLTAAPSPRVPAALRPPPWAAGGVPGLCALPDRLDVGGVHGGVLR